MLCTVFRAVRIRISLGLVVAIVLAGASHARAVLAVTPIELVPASHIGWDVNRATGGGICAVAWGAECQKGTLSGEPGGFAYLSSIAVAPSGELYVTDDANDRIQAFTAAGAFVAAFGWDVNATEDGRATATQAERDLCTAASGDACVAGAGGTGAGQLGYPSSVAADPLTGDVYVLDSEPDDDRVEKYTPAGRFVWTIGGHVNASRGSDICSEREIERAGVKCQAGAESTAAGVEPGSFKFASHAGDLLAAGGPEDLLYVGDEYGVQEFDADGQWKREILLASLSSLPGSDVVALAVDRGGELYLVYHAPGAESAGHAELGNNIVHKFRPDGEPILEFPVDAVEPEAPVGVDGIAVDGSDRLAVIGAGDRAGSPVHFGSLYNGDTGMLIGEFTVPSDFDGLTFNDEDDLYIAATDRQEVVAYTPAPAAELLTSPVTCQLGAQPGTVAAFNCALSWQVGR
jgi:DNA-binding beta-propeller fold protein YncE